LSFRHLPPLTQKIILAEARQYMFAQPEFCLLAKHANTEEITILRRLDLAMPRRFLSFQGHI